MENSLKASASSDHSALNSFRNPILLIPFFVMMASFLSLYSEATNLQTKAINTSHAWTVEKTLPLPIKNAHNSKD